MNPEWKAPLMIRYFLICQRVKCEKITFVINDSVSSRASILLHPSDTCLF